MLATRLVIDLLKTVYERSGFGLLLNTNKRTDTFLDENDGVRIQHLVGIEASVFSPQASSN